MSSEIVWVGPVVVKAPVTWARFIMLAEAAGIKSR